MERRELDEGKELVELEFVFAVAFGADVCLLLNPRHWFHISSQLR